VLLSQIPFHKPEYELIPRNSKRPWLIRCGRTTLLASNRGGIITTGRANA